jgi:hypothetical protein
MAFIKHFWTFIPTWVCHMNHMGYFSGLTEPAECPVIGHIQTIVFNLDRKQGEIMGTRQKIHWDHSVTHGFK